MVLLFALFLAFTESVSLDPNDIYFSQATIGPNVRITNDALHDALHACGVVLTAIAGTTHYTAPIASVSDPVAVLAACPDVPAKTALKAAVEARWAPVVVDWGNTENPRYTAESNRRTYLARKWRGQFSSGNSIDCVVRQPNSADDLTPADFEKQVCIGSDSAAQDAPNVFVCRTYQPANWGEAVEMRSLSNGLPKHGASAAPTFNNQDIRAADKKLHSRCGKPNGANHANAADGPHPANLYDNALITKFWIQRYSDLSEVFFVLRADMANFIDTVFLRTLDVNLFYNCNKRVGNFLELMNKKSRDNILSPEMEE